MTRGNHLHQGSSCGICISPLVGIIFIQVATSSKLFLSFVIMCLSSCSRALLCRYGSTYTRFDVAGWTGVGPCTRYSVSHAIHP
ncbi:hypothetical protein EDD16DRAFT_1554637 [Pisolithus croceorrhizus]|nr:hypothetical protein EDD16DRAFT_1554637 [Pisolithus croceorrhizus]